MSNRNLQAAKKAKNDEFYTRLEDIEAELKHYGKHFLNKTVYCNCDSPFQSNFFKYFVLNFNELGLKKLICTCYADSPITGAAYKAVVTNVSTTDIKSLLNQGGNSLTRLNGDGDFRSPECTEILKEADMVVTNPPFSLFREYIAQLMDYHKKFLVIGNLNAITYKEIFPLLKNNEMRLGYGVNKTVEFIMSDDHELKGEAYIDENGKKHDFIHNARWFTNLDIEKRHEPLPLTKRYDPESYPKYDNYDAINVDRVSDIPMDYEPCWFECDKADQCLYARAEGLKDAPALCEGKKKTGVIGVPVTFFDKHCPSQFRIIGLDRYTAPKEVLVGGRLTVNGKTRYCRILIQKV